MAARKAGWIPHEPHDKQAEFITLPDREALYGGAAGGGKSDALLMCALQFVHVPGYAALLIRQTFADLSKPDALIPRAHEWLGGTAAVWSEQRKEYRFPSGAVVAFGYLDSPRDHFQYQGAALQTVCFDELTQLREEQYRYLFSRLRRLEGVNIPLRMRSASNPGGTGHEWVASRFGLGEYESTGTNDGERRPFVPAYLEDNPSIDQAAYRASLMHLDPTTREQLLNGDWRARKPGSVFRREWFQLIDADEVPIELRRLRAWDRAATAVKDGNDPDWSAGVLVGEHEGTYYILDMQRFRGTSRQNEERIQRTALEDGEYTPIRMEQEPGSSGNDTIDHYARRVLMGHDFRGVRPTGSKPERAAIWASAAEQGNVYVVRGPWTAAFLAECEEFPNGGHDDQVDAVSLAITCLKSASRPRIRR